MKTRIIQTRFWDDDFVNGADIYTQHLYIYLLTSQYINLCGIFQLPERKIMFEAKLSEKQFDSAKKSLEESGKVFFYRGWVFVTNARKNNNYENYDGNKRALGRELEKVPTEVKDYFNSSPTLVSQYTDSNNKSEIRNNK